MAGDPRVRAHQEWIGYAQPVGLVVSPHALVEAQALVDSNVIRQQQVLTALLGEDQRLRDLPALFRDVLGWSDQDFVVPTTLEAPVREYGEVLRPTYGVPDVEDASRWLLLVLQLDQEGSFDEVEPERADGRHWHAAPQARFERLLRETRVPIGLLAGPAALRLVYAPSGESSGHVTFPLPALTEVAGRPLLSALLMLLGADRLFALPTKQRLPELLVQSRRYQNIVSTRLAEQVLGALHELLRGFQAADDASQRALLQEVLAKAPQDVYGGLLGTLLRLVFVLYAEDRGLLPVGNPVYQQHYSLTGLFERLRDDASRYPDTMDSRFGAWSQLLTLFRLIHDGASHGGLSLPPRHGRLFDPDTWDFLEGRPYGDLLDRRQQVVAPRVPDGVIFRVLDKLLMLDGDRISYRNLDVEQIGSVYEAMMGFELRIARGPSIALRPDNVVVDLGEVLGAKDRSRWLRDLASCDVTGKALEALRSATTPEEVVAALGRKVSAVTPAIVPAGAMYLQPGDERRKSGSHYTPRSLTEPIVRTTLEPVVRGLSRPEQILSLKVCDPAMGSGAFLVEACRYLGKALVQAWEAHGAAPAVPPDEDLQLHAQRLVAQRCLYGVDKNPYAVDLAKLSLWLATFAADHPFTFLDHALAHGDSLVGLDRGQLVAFHWNPREQVGLLQISLKSTIETAIDKRAALHALGDDFAADQKKRELHSETTRALRDVRLAADSVVAAFFSKDKPKEREAARLAHRSELMAVLEGAEHVERLQQRSHSIRSGARAVVPFHWEIEFPEVFARENPGFDAFVGNPPFAGKNTLISATRAGYPDWLKVIHEETHGNADLVAHFFRRAFSKLRKGGTLGLIATNTIAQGDTRGTGLRWICTHGGTIYAARKRVKWPAPGAAVVVSVVHIANGEAPQPCVLDGRPVERITAFLFHDGGHEDPKPLPENAGKSFQGSIVLGMGFTFDDDNDEATPIAEMHRLIAKDPRNAERIFPYIGGEEVNDSPTHAHRRYVINFGEMSEEEARRWPDLMEIVEAKVKPERIRLADNPDGRRRKKYWWQWGRLTPALEEAIRGLDRVLANSQVSSYTVFAEQPAERTFAHTLYVYALPSRAAFAVLQSRLHDVWARFLGSSLEERFRYTAADCFETFPFPTGWDTDRSLDIAGDALYDFRATLMVSRNEGLTRTYNRLHDPSETHPDILKLRQLHDAMDRAVLEAYGWIDLEPRCEFLLDFEDDADPYPDSSRMPRRKPWRYRWPDDIRDEVLARLLALNHLRSREIDGAALPKSELTRDVSTPDRRSRRRSSDRQ